MYEKHRSRWNISGLVALFFIYSFVSLSLGPLVGVEPSGEEIHCTKGNILVPSWHDGSLEIHFSQSSTIPSSIQRKQSLSHASQRFLLFGLEFSPGDQHHNFVISCATFGGWREREEAKEKEPHWRRGQESWNPGWLFWVAAWLNQNRDHLTFILFFTVKICVNEHIYQLISTLVP